MAKKVCCTCKKSKEISEFGKNKRIKDGLHRVCKECRSSYDKEYRVKFPEKNKNRTKNYYQHRKEAYRKLKKKCLDYLGGKCVRCGFNKWLSAIDFHHIDPSVKDYEMGEFIISNCSVRTDIDKVFKKIKPELDKCVPMCRNCHIYEHRGY